MANKCTESRQGWSCLVYQNETDDDPRIKDRGDNVPWNDVQLPSDINPTQLSAEALVKITKEVCVRCGPRYKEGVKIIWEKRDDDPNCYDLAFDAEGNSIHPDLYLKT